ncbi:TetR/AcrR family transcriptional regulator [Kineosporia succinea]|uniref:DNA-binding transcriptional regulator YbjK n=1 Tax=Kineosporia succinea TaxID=84632 RepID=A0ABT9PCN0_9ACTN|nr:TetR family transcriptional regulator C-terminal domain-containing protein [Kineosporia succinea]MDP9830466.1 DNA-binding transcriptional regulator YbjK [Kineosporia succinea]
MSGDRRPRRTDPQRRERILDAAITVMAARGVVGATHRVIAEAADVPLGSLTYYFSSLDDLRTHAFIRLSERLGQAYRARFDAVTDVPGLIEAVTGLIHDAAGASTDEWAVSYELYGAALRDPALREVTENWMRASRSVLERFVEPDTARALDALIEGLVIHSILSTAPPSREQIREAVRRLVS